MRGHDELVTPAVEQIQHLTAGCFDARRLRGSTSSIPSGSSQRSTVAISPLPFQPGGTSSVNPVKKQGAEQHAAQPHETQVTVAQPADAGDRLAPLSRTQERQDAFQHQHETKSDAEFCHMILADAKSRDFPAGSS